MSTMPAELEDLRVPDRVPLFPSALAAEIERRRMALLAQANGIILDLDLPEARAEVQAAALAARHGESRTDGPYDTVVSTGQLVGFADLHQALVGIERLLAPDGELLVLEPTNHTGRIALVTSTIWARHPTVAGLHLERDLAATIRVVGLTPTDFERFSMPTYIRPLRRFLEARARRFPTPPARP